MRKSKNHPSDEEVQRTPLSQLWANLYSLMRFNPAMFGELVDRYLDVAGNENVSTPKARNTTKHRIIKQLSEPDLTEKTFYKGIRISQFTRGTLIFRGWRGNSPVPIEVSANFVIGSNSYKFNPTKDASDNDGFFVSKAHKYCFALTNTDGKTRMKILGDVETNHTSKEAAKQWRNEIASVITNGAIPLALKNNSIKILDELYKVMIDDYTSSK